MWQKLFVFWRTSFLQNGGTQGASWALVSATCLLLLLLVPLPSAVFDVLVVLSGAASVVWLFASVLGDQNMFLPKLPGFLLFSLLSRLGLTLALSRLCLQDGQPGAVVRAVPSLLAGSEQAVGWLVLMTLLAVEYFLLARGGERVAEVAARFVLDAMPGRQAAIEADHRQGTLDAVSAQAARTALHDEATLYGALDGVLRLLRADVWLAALLWMCFFIAQLVSLSQTADFPLADAARSSARAVLAVGLSTQVPFLLVAFSAVRLLLRKPRPVATQPSAVSLQVLCSAAVPIETVKRALKPVIERLGLSTLSFAVAPFAARTASHPTLRLHAHGQLLTERAFVPGDNAERWLSELLLSVAPRLLTLEVVRQELAALAIEQQALVLEVVPKRISLGRLLCLLRRLLLSRVLPLPLRSVLESLVTLPELHEDLDALFEQVRAGLGPELLHGHLPTHLAEPGLPVLVLSDDLDGLLRESKRGGVGMRLSLEPDLRQEIIDSVRLAKQKHPDAVVVCQKDLRPQLEALLPPETLPILSFAELPAHLPLHVLSRIGP